MSRVVPAAVLIFALAACGQSAPPPPREAAPVVREEPSGSSTDREPTPSTDKVSETPLPRDPLALAFTGIGGQPGGPNSESADGHTMIATNDGRLLAGGAGVLELDPGGRWSALGAGLDGNVRSLAIAPDGTVLAGLSGGAHGGVAQLAPGATRWELLGDAFAGLPVSSVAAGAGGLFAAAGDYDVHRWDGAARSWGPIGPRRPGTLISVIATAPDGSLVAAGTAASLRASVLRLRDGNWSVVPGSDDLPGSVRALFVAPDGTLFVSVESPTGGEVMHLPASGRHFSRAGEGLPAGAVFELAQSPDGRLVAGARSGTGGVFELVGSNWTVLGSGLPAGPVEAVAASSHGTFARVDGTAFALHDRVWEPLHDGLVAAGANALLATPDRGLVAGTAEGLAVLGPSGRWTSEDAGAPGTELLALAATPDGSLIAGTAWNGVVRRARDGRWESLPGGLPESATVRSVAVAANGTAWAAVEGTSDRAGGVYRQAAGATGWQAAGAGLPGGGVTSILLDPDGGIWAGVNGGEQPGVFRLAPQATLWSRSEPVPEGVSRLALARDGSVVAGTYGAGIRRLDRSTGAWTALGHGLPGGLEGWVLDLEDDARLGLLAGTNSGLYRLAAERWEPVDAGLPRAAVTDLLRDGDRLIVATRSSGAFASVR